MEDFIVHGLAGVQSGLSVYILYHLIRSKARYRHILFFSLIVFLFVVLKNRLIMLTPYTAIDGIAWAIYNIGIYGFIYLLIRK